MSCDVFFFFRVTIDWEGVVIQPILNLTYLQAAEAASEDPEPTPTEGVQGFNGDLRPAGVLDEQMSN